MGQITIEVPQRINRSYRITDKDYVRKLLKDLENSDDPVKKSVAEDAADIERARKARAEYQRTGETATVAELRKEFGL